VSAAGLASEDFSRLYAYNRWANARAFESASALTSEELRREVGGSFATVLGTFTHLVGAEWVWLERWRGRSPRGLPTGFSTLEELRASLTEVEAGQNEVLAAVTPARLAERLSYVNFAGQTWTYSLADMLLHLPNHGTYHRGQIATLLRQLGKKPLSTDYLLFLDAKG
jgi:uncharacterized damage-inducible protein DinB